MPTPPLKSDLSLKGLELFQTFAQTRSLQATAKEAGLSVSTVSHHLRNLEDSLGTALFDHARRPMVLTPKGHTFLRHITQAMHTIRTATAEASAGNVMDTSYLRIGTIEDLDSDVTPDLAVYLSRQLPACDFVYRTGTSHEIIRMLHHRELDLGIVSAPPGGIADLVSLPLLRDPFVAVLPVSSDFSVSDIIAGRGKLPFLQFSKDLIIAGQIEAQLHKRGIQLPHKFECGNNQILMAMVAEGAGWTITTPLLFSRARRFQPKLRMHPLPGKGFGRTLSLIGSPDCAQSVTALVNLKARSSLKQQIISAMHDKHVWLKDQFFLMEEPRSKTAL